MHILNAPAWLEDSPYTLLSLTGSDVRKYLQSKLTRNVDLWNEQVAYYAISTDINGKILFDGEFFVHTENHVDIWLPSSVFESAREHISKYIITEDVSVSEPSRSSYLLFAQSKEALEGALAAVEQPLNEGADSEVAEELYAYERPRSVVPSSRLVIPDELEESLQALLKDQATIEREQLEQLEIQQGFPRFERDYFKEKTIPLEAGLFEGIDFNKGCYLGQEVIERLHSRGTPARRLAHLQWDGASAQAGTPLTTDSRNGGSITSVYTEGATSTALGYVRRKYIEQMDALSIGDSDVSPTMLSLYGNDDS